MARIRRTGRTSILILVVALAVGVAACGGGGGGDSSSSSKAVSGDAVTIKGFAFNPSALKVKVGTTVTWSNKDSSTHTATADGGSFDTKSIKKGATATVTFSKAGTFQYHCDIHPSMHGSIVVS